MFSYRWPLLFAVLLHIVLITLFFIELPTPHYRAPGPVSHHKIIQANTVNQAAVNQVVERIQRQKALARQRQHERDQRLRRQAERLRVQRLQERRHLQRLQAEQRRLRIKRAQQQAVEKRLARTERLHAQRLAKQKALQKAKQQRLAAQSRRLQQQMLSQQLANEQKQLAAAQASQQRRRIDGIVNIYISRIRNKVHTTWTKPQNNAKKLSASFAIQLAPGGVVLAVKLLRSSGDGVFDRSAKVAIFKASPLPVPKSVLAFDKFRQFDFTFHS